MAWACGLLGRDVWLRRRMVIVTATRSRMGRLNDIKMKQHHTLGPESDCAQPPITTSPCANTPRDTVQEPARSWAGLRVPVRAGQEGATVLYYLHARLLETSKHRGKKATVLFVPPPPRSKHKATDDAFRGRDVSRSGWLCLYDTGRFKTLKDCSILRLVGNGDMRGFLRKLPVLECLSRRGRG